MVKIGLKLPVYEFEAELTSRMTLINGLSGKGKTTLVDYLFSPQYEGVREVILSDASYDIVYGNPALKTISSQESKKIFIFDEDINLNDRRLSVIFHNVTDCYFVMITRDPIKTLSYSIEDIYTFMADGKRHWLEKYVDKHVSKWAPGKEGQVGFGSFLMGSVYTVFYISVKVRNSEAGSLNCYKDTRK